MRIGQVNQDNYKDMLKILGVKNPKSLEKLHGEEKADGLDPFGQKIGDYSLKAQEARAVKAGLALEGMVRCDATDNGSWKKIVNVPDSIKQKIIDKSREMIIANGNGSITAEQGDEYTKMIMDYLKTIPPEERKSANYTLREIGREERQRIVDYLKAEIGWQAGQSFDKKILTESNWGLCKGHFDTRA